MIPNKYNKLGRKIISDFLYNIIASALVTVTLQLIIYPRLAANLSAETYGKLLTIMGLANIFIVSLGGSLNNVRLIQNGVYEEKKYSGDYNIILLGVVFCCIVFFPAIIYAGFRIKGIFLLLIYVTISVISNYWLVSYRLVLNYKSNLVYNFLRCLGYIIGILFYKAIDWCAIFAIGEIIGILYLLYSTALYKESWTVTPLFFNTLKIYVVLVCTNFVANIVNYLDRIFLYPLLGGEQVTIYTVSTFLGKSVGLIISPIAGVLLSYYAQKTFKMTLKKYWIINCITLIGGTGVGVVLIFLAPSITKLFYPTLIDSTRNYLTIANISSLIGALTYIVSPSILKFSSIIWQIAIQLMYMVVYFSAGYLFITSLGLLGFCYATIIANVFRLTVLLIIGHFSLRGE